MVVCLIFAAGNARAAVPQVEWSVDSQKPAATWTLTAFAGATPLIRVDLLQNGEAWFPSSDWSGELWYGTNSDWDATSKVSVVGVFTSLNSYIDFQCTSNTFGSNGTFYGGVVMTNTTQTIEWGRGTLTVKNSGGISASGILDLRGAGVSVSGGLLTKVGAVIGLTSNAVLTAAGSLTNGLGTASTNRTADFATAAQGTLAGNALPKSWTNSAALPALDMQGGNITNIAAVGTVTTGQRIDFANGRLWCTDASVSLDWDGRAGYGPSSMQVWSWDDDSLDLASGTGLTLDGTNIQTIIDNSIAAAPQTNTMCWTYALPTTNWGPMVTAASTITRITAQAYSGGMTANVYYKYWTNGWGNLTLLGTMPCIGASSQSNFSWAVPVNSMIGLAFPGGSTQEVVFSVDVLQ